MQIQKIMKNLLLLLAISLVFSCKEDKKENKDYSKETLNITTSIYPDNLNKVYNAHGGIDNWNKFSSLTFTMQKSSGKEQTITDLKKRYSLIEMPNHSIGYNGEVVWLHSKDTTAYKGNPKFYYNLMFYFCAMPFILGDDGIHYEESKPLVFEGKSFLGIKISYEKGIGESPDDEYIMYYDPETYKMSWLAYTVTYFTQEKSKEFHFLQYTNWQEIEGLLLPETITWYNYENNKPTSQRNNITFTEVTISKEKPDSGLFQKPENAQIIN